MAANESTQLEELMNGHRRCMSDSEKTRKTGCVSPQVRKPTNVLLRMLHTGLEGVALPCTTAMVTQVMQRHVLFTVGSHSPRTFKSDTCTSTGWAGWVLLTRLPLTTTEQPVFRSRALYSGGEGGERGREREREEGGERGGMGGGRMIKH